ncbi:MAG: hypothetical protein R2685_12905 [Candidatus Nitrosocosmicus sp.]|nr:hypothetical protein [Candidatus Nitrosocosmicus sp.]
MAVVSTEKEIEDASKKAVDALFGSLVQNFKIREVFPYSADQIITHSDDMDTESQSRDGWDVQVTFMLDNLQYTVDLIIQEKDGHVIYSRLIDKMAPL